ncbi:SDR family NAD(P)-dependent oxidoreductase [Archangium gephyra]|uniref:SDR family NAD(P)-dependent oxidoreductase n=1 Tax=Archangium gephyra TaxID=48 RepID=UPI003B76D42D
MKGLAGKVALVTGGSSGIGLAAARELGKAGAKVALVGRVMASVCSIHACSGWAALKATESGLVRAPEHHGAHLSWLGARQQHNLPGTRVPSAQ